MAYTIDEKIFDIAVNKMLEIIPKQKEHDGSTRVTFNKGFFPSTEGYKYNKALPEAKNALDSDNWTREMIGTGHIYADVLSALGKNYLLNDYHTNDFENKSKSDLESSEKLLYMFYRGADDEEAFNSLLNFYGKRYSLLAFLMFLKNRTGSKEYIKYLPCRNAKFSSKFKTLGIKTHCVDDASCSWENYMEFLSIIKDVKLRLEKRMACPVTLIDAHSFVWAAYLLEDTGIPTMFEDYVEGQISISKEQWLSCLQDEGVTPEKIRDLLIQIYHYPDMAASCKELGIDDDVNSSSFISPVVNFGKKVLEKLNLNTPKRPNGENTYWVIPFLGRYKKIDGMKVFDWKLRPELAEAMQDIWVSETIEVRTNRDIKEAPTKTAADLFEAVSKNPYKENKKVKTVVEQYSRDPRVREFAKKCAKGVCQLRGETLEFNDSNGLPYLETHHIIPLAEGGQDIFENVIALCPNCHKQMHILKDPRDIGQLLEIAAAFVKMHSHD